jgi:hypothetical protein
MHILGQDCYIHEKELPLIHETARPIGVKFVHLKKAGLIDIYIKAIAEESFLTPNGEYRRYKIVPKEFVIESHCIEKEEE